MSTETLVGQTTRPVTFIYSGTDKTVPAHCRNFPAGTTVYVSESMRTNKGLFMVRIPGTLYIQHVTPGSVEPA